MEEEDRAKLETMGREIAELRRDLEALKRPAKREETYGGCVKALSVVSVVVVVTLAVALLLFGNCLDITPCQ